MSIKQGNNYIAAGGGTGAWGSITGTLSDQTDLNTALENKANDVDVVKLTGNQTVGGTKTFNATIRTTVQGESIDLIRKSTSDTSGTAFADLQFKDTQNNRKGGIRNIIENGNTTLMYVTNEAGNSIKGTIAIGYDESNNSVFTAAPTPATTDNSTKIATTAFVKAQGYSSISSIFPVGSCYITIGNTNPNTILGVGTWTLVTSSVITSVDTSVPVKGNGKTLGLTNGTANVGMSTSSWSAVRFYPDGAAYNVDVGNSHTETVPADSYSWGVTTDETKSGIVGTVTRTSTTIYIWQRTA